jgi:signal transduction histidine kinase
MENYRVTYRNNEIQVSLEVLNKKVKSLERAKSKLVKQNREFAVRIDELKMDKEKLSENNYYTGLTINSLLKENEESIRGSYNQPIIERVDSAALKDKESDTWKDILYKLAHSINNDLHNAAQILQSKDSDEELTNAFYHIKRIDDLVKLNLWLLKKNELPEEYKTIELSKEIEELIASTKRGLSTLRVSAEFQIKLARLNVTTNNTGNSTITSMREKLDTVISIILQDLIRNAFKYSDSNDPDVEVIIDGSSEDEVKIIFVNNKIMEDRFVRYINFRDTEPDISDSSKVGLRSILDWVKIISDMQITCSNNLSQNKCEIELIIPRNVDYENN